MSTPLPRLGTVVGTAVLGIVAFSVWLVARQYPHLSPACREAVRSFHSGCARRAVGRREPFRDTSILTTVGSAALEVAWLRRWAKRRLGPRRARIVRWTVSAPAAFAVGGLAYNSAPASFRKTATAATPESPSVAA